MVPSGKLSYFAMLYSMREINGAMRKVSGTILDTNPRKACLSPPYTPRY
jgi:hypothetical protein